MSKSITNQVYSALKKVYDPEVNVSVVDMGLIYDVREKDGKVTITYTLTSMGCPLAFEIEHLVKSAIKKIKGVKSVKLKLVWDPPWDQSKMSSLAKAELGLD
jgi:metal-sulfur cluster biosynthetic enzyme